MTDGPAPSVRSEATLDGTLGLELLDVGPDRAVGRFVVEDRVRQPYGLVHGGAYAAIAESLTSLATHQSVRGEGMVALGLSNSTTFLRPVAKGSVSSEGRPRHRGRTTWLWHVDHTDDDGRLCAVSEVLIAVRPAPE